MKWSSIELIVAELFKGLKSPFRVLGQESCTKVETSRGIYLTGINNSKELFFKDLSTTLFEVDWSSHAPFTSDNTLLIDDSLDKSECNENGNAIILDSWTRQAYTDGFLIEKLLPWLQDLHLSCRQRQLREYVEKNRIGHLPFGPDNSLLQHIREGMRTSAKNLGCKFKLLGIGEVITPKKLKSIFS